MPGPLAEARLWRSGAKARLEQAAENAPARQIRLTTEDTEDTGDTRYRV